VPHAGGKKGKYFILGHFYNIFNFEVGRIPSLSPVALGQGKDLGRLLNTPMLILRYPKSLQEEISTLISKRFAIEMELCGLRGGGQGAGTGYPKSG
jgi:hypothetical protein